MSESKNKVWAWIRRNKPSGDFIKRSSFEKDEALIAADDDEVDAWFFVGPRDNGGEPIFGGHHYNGALYVSVKRDDCGSLVLKVYIKKSKSDVASDDGSGILVYQGPLMSTDEDVFNFWSQMVADKLRKEEG